VKQFEEQRVEYGQVSSFIAEGMQTSLSSLFPLVVARAALAVGHVHPISVRTVIIDEIRPIYDSVHRMRVRVCVGKITRAAVNRFE